MFQVFLTLNYNIILQKQNLSIVTSDLWFMKKYWEYLHFRKSYCMNTIDLYDSLFYYYKWVDNITS